MPLLDKVFGQPALRETVRIMLKDAKFVDEERRKQGRLPYFHPVMIKLDEGEELYSALTRDVSATGMGLLHWMPIESQVITVICHLHNEAVVRLRVDIDWCMSCGEGWYISGGEFLDVQAGLN